MGEMRRASAPPTWDRLVMAVSLQWTRRSAVIFLVFLVSVLSLSGGGRKRAARAGSEVGDWSGASMNVPAMFKDRVLDMPLPEVWSPVFRFMGGKGTGQFCAVYAHQGDYGGTVLTVTNLIHHLTEPRVVIEAGNPLNVVSPTPRAMLAAATALRGGLDSPDPKGVLVLGIVSGHPLANYAEARWPSASVHVLEASPEFATNGALAAWDIGKNVRAASGKWAEAVGMEGESLRGTFGVKLSYDIVMQDDVCACCADSCQTLGESDLTTLYTSVLAPDGLYLRTLGRYTIDSLTDSPPGVVPMMQRVFDRVILVETGRDGGEKIAVGIKGERKAIDAAELADIAASLTSIRTASDRPPRAHEL